ncbi:hypothetical protein GCM10027059_49480 [Myceligenerans halotolerans]
MTAIPQAAREQHAARRDRALGALRAVETRTGVRAHVPAAREESGPGGKVRPVGPEVAHLLPDGGLVAGTTVVVSGSTTLLLALLAAPSRAGAWTVFVGHPEVGLAAAAGAGCDLDRIVCVPDPGADAPAVVAALLDGMDLVVVGPRTALLDADRRRLTARARERDVVLLVAQTAPAGAAAWPGAHVVLSAGPGTWEGVDHGAGRLRRRTLTVRRTGRGSAARPVALPCTPVAEVRAG